MQAHPALVLNADFRPLSYFPLSLLSWQDAITAVFKDHVSVVAEYDKWVSSPSTKMRLPSVVALRDNRTNMKPLRAPFVPTARDLLAAKRAFPPNYLHATWLDYLYWDTELEPG